MLALGAVGQSRPCRLSCRDGAEEARIRDLGWRLDGAHYSGAQSKFVQASTAAGSPPRSAALDNARRKAYWRLLPLLFVCYVIAFVDQTNVAIAKLTTTRDLPGFDNAVIGFGFGMFFIGYFLL
jgi:hypothetical protein